MWLSQGPVWRPTTVTYREVKSGRRGFLEQQPQQEEAGKACGDEGDFGRSAVGQGGLSRDRR